MCGVLNVMGRLVSQLLWPAAAGNLLWLLSEVSLEFIIDKKSSSPWLIGIYILLFIYMTFSYLRRSGGYEPKTMGEAISAVLHPIILIFCVHTLNISAFMGTCCLIFLFFSTAFDHYSVIEKLKNLGGEGQHIRLFFVNFTAMIFLFVSIFIYNNYIIISLILFLVLASWLYLRKPWKEIL